MLSIDFYCITCWSRLRALSITKVNSEQWVYLGKGDSSKFQYTRDLIITNLFTATNSIAQQQPHSPNPSAWRRWHPCACRSPPPRPPSFGYVSATVFRCHVTMMRDDRLPGDGTHQKPSTVHHAATVGHASVSRYIIKYCLQCPGDLLGLTYCI